MKDVPSVHPLMRLLRPAREVSPISQGRASVVWQRGSQDGFCSAVMVCGNLWPAPACAVFVSSFTISALSERAFHFLNLHSLVGL